LHQVKHSPLSRGSTGSGLSGGAAGGGRSTEFATVVRVVTLIPSVGKMARKMLSAAADASGTAVSNVVFAKLTAVSSAMGKLASR